MPFSASADPTSGVTPGDFEVTPTGGVPPYSIAADPSPPNPDPMPDYEIVGTAPPWTVEIKEPVPSGMKLYFTVADADVDTYQVSYESE